MALFNDGTFSSVQDLQAYESSILEIASIEKINLETKLRLAHQEIKNLIQHFLVDQTTNLNEKPAILIEQIAVTDALKEWHVLHALNLTLRDCYHNQLNDRYEKKWQEYQKKSEQSAIRFFDTGAGVVWNPVPRAEMPVLEHGAGTLEAGSYEIYITWLDQNLVESEPSSTLMFETDNGSVPVLRVENVPDSIHFWNVYMCEIGKVPIRQNNVELPVHASWTMTENELRPGKQIGSGQNPDYFLRLMHCIKRG